MRKTAISAVLLLAVLPANAQDAAKPARDFVVIHMERTVDRPAAQVWSHIGGYCQIEDWFGTKCVITNGNGDIGTNRRLNGTLDELMVAKTPLSYGYTQPASPIFVHGNMAVEPIDAGHSRIVYDMLYDAAALTTPEARAAENARRKARFEAALDKMKQIAESAP